MGTVLSLRQAARRTSVSSLIKAALTDGLPLPPIVYALGHQKASGKRFMIALRLNEAGDYESGPITMDEAVLSGVWDGYGRFVAL